LKYSNFSRLEMPSPETISPLLSVIIPTRERAGTLRYTLATALQQESRDYEVVVSDNASEDGTRQVVGAINDARVRYFHTGRRLSMCDNYEFALNCARGTYVVMIGDDDAVIPSKLDFLLSHLRALADVMIHTWPLHIYDWPVEGRPARLVYLAGKRPAQAFALRPRAHFTMAMGGWRYGGTPSPYHSAIPRRFLESLRMRTGRVFHSTQPDVFTSMAMPAFADQAVDLGETITFNGRSARSNGLGFINRSAMVNIERFIREYGDYRFHPSLYPGVSGPANMIPDAVLVARDLFPEVYAGVEFGYSQMWAYVCRLGFASHAEVLRNRRQIARMHKFSAGTFLFYSLVHEVLALRREILNNVAGKNGLAWQVPGNIRDFAQLLA
jgi:glycosyltransferase involved in cell wall biosynthesis